jgi:hypothetical protein
VAGINDAGTLAGSGSAGAMLLVPNGNLAVPTAPANLDAQPHVPTWQQPWNAIALTWTTADELTTSYRIERRESGAAQWAVIEAQWDGIQLWDLDVSLGVTYDYRVVAVGLAGDSPASATATSEPVDIDGPQVTTVAPEQDASVEGVFRVLVEADDNVGIEFMDILVVGELATETLCHPSWRRRESLRTASW